jgi:hypothetical protein
MTKVRICSDMFFLFFVYLSIIFTLPLKNFFHLLKLEWSSLSQYIWQKLEKCSDMLLFLLSIFAIIFTLPLIFCVWAVILKSLISLYITSLSVFNIAVIELFLCQFQVTTPFSHQLHYQIPRSFYCSSAYTLLLYLILHFYDNNNHVNFRQQLLCRHFIFLW